MMKDEELSRCSSERDTALTVTVACGVRVVVHAMLRGTGSFDTEASTGHDLQEDIMHMWSGGSVIWMR